MFLTPRKKLYVSRQNKNFEKNIATKFLKVDLNLLSF